MASDEIKLVLMSIGLTVAVISLILTIRNRMVDKKKELNISYTTQALLSEYDGVYHGLVLCIYVLNSGNVSIFINRPYLKTPFKKDGFNQYELLSSKDTTIYPVKLEPGAEHSIKLDLLNFIDGLDYINWYRRIRFEVKNSKGKIYKSKKIWFKNIIKQRQLHKLMMKQQNA